jgi:NHL repeat-containing protein
VKRGRIFYGLVAVAVLVVAFGLSNPYTLAKPSASTVLTPPTFVVDPFWPKPLPDNWVTGEIGGTCIDSQDHLFVVTRGFQNAGLVAPEGIGGRPTKSKASPPVIEFDPDGNVVNSWGDPSLVPATVPAGPNDNKNAVLPNGIHGCFVDYQDNVWIGGNGDGIVQKYSHNGTLLMTIGTKFKCDTPNNLCTNQSLDGHSTTLLNLPADIAVDPANGEVYIADGYGNHRVVVFDKNGVYQRQFGGLGTGDGAFTIGGGGHPHCVVIGKDGLVYACDRGNDRINVYHKDGSFVRAITIIPGTGTLTGTGSAWDVDFSPDAVQTFMYESDGGNEIMWIMDHAAALGGSPGAILSGFGRPGHMAGDFTFLHMMAIDSTGNLYAGETVGGRRVQKFVRTSNCPGNSEGHGGAGLYQCPGNSGH